MSFRLRIYIYTAGPKYVDLPLKFQPTLLVSSLNCLISVDQVSTRLFLEQVHETLKAPKDNAKDSHVVFPL